MLLKATLVVASVLACFNWVSTDFGNQNLRQQTQQTLKSLPISAPNDICYEIFKLTTITELSDIARTSKSMQRVVTLYFKDKFLENERLELLTNLFKGILNYDGELDADTRVQIRFIFGLIIDTFKTGDITDWQLDEIKYIGQKDVPVCFLDDLKVHTKIKLAILEAVELLIEFLPSTFSRLNLSGKIVVRREEIFLTPHPELIKFASMNTLKKKAHMELSDISDYLIAYGDPSDEEDLAKLLLSPHIIPLLHRYIAALRNPKLDDRPLPPNVFSCEQSILILAHLANENNWKQIWSYISKTPSNHFNNALLVLLRKKTICQDLLKQMIISIDGRSTQRLHTLAEFAILQFLRGTASNEIYKLLLEKVNSAGSVTIGLLTKNQYAAELEKLVILDDCKDQEKLMGIIQQAEFEPSFVLSIVCAMKGLSPEFIREMLKRRKIDLAKMECDPFYPPLFKYVPLDEVNVEALKVIVEVLSNEYWTDERFILDTRVITKDEVMLKLVKHLYRLKKEPVKIDEFSCWSFPRTAQFILKKIEIEDRKVTGYFDTPVGKKFKEWFLNQEKADSG